ncbi:hypothetical protein HDU81_004832 [Chytriomyces hyalinus]|nr:hypothetical protein HDU81_004832 [Chytriomyces hyalinus]
MKSRGFEDFNAVSPALVPTPLLVTNSEGTASEARPLKRGPASSSAIALKLLASHAQSEHNPLHSFPTSVLSNRSKKHHVAQKFVEHDFFHPSNQSGVLQFSAASKINNTYEPIQVKYPQTITTRRVVKPYRSRRRKFILAKAPVTQAVDISATPPLTPPHSQSQPPNEETSTPHVTFAEQPLLKTMPAKTLPRIFSQLETVTESFSKLSSDMLLLNANLFTKPRTKTSARSTSKSSQHISPPLKSLQDLLQYMQDRASQPPTFQDTQYLKLLKKAADAGSVFAKYNLAVCLVQLGELDVAVALFGAVMSRTDRGSRMYEDAKFNLKVLVA